MDKELYDIVFHGREERNIEYKSSVSWNDPKIKAKISKCILAMSNIRDGGYLVIGVNDKAFDPVGMTKEDFDSFNQDNINSHIANYADPFVDITVFSEEHEGKKFIIIRINEFHEIPIICKKDFDEYLKILEYIRPRIGENDKFFNFEFTIYRITEIFEFISRLNVLRTLEPDFELSIIIKGVKDRELFGFQRDRFLAGTFKSVTDEIEYTKEFSSNNFLGNMQDYTLTCIEKVFERFNFYLSNQIINEIQEKIRK